ncbi:unnamed protein product [Ostreobium quekettii]|uniref:IFT122 zinc ribbon domain-containing protein n=1 Tax=Ostreobium quekettii TaxID=121088 RepID=A0A8S1IT18_9CHLO|nr:unnamed protein product [Ostreobium quekettii]
MGAFKLARTAYQRLQTLRLPSAWKEEVDLHSVLVRSKPFLDKEELLPVCYRCGTTNPLLSSHGDRCVTCGNAFIRSFLTFDLLPLVEFMLEDGISPDEAMEIIGEEATNPSARPSGARERIDEDAQVLTLDDPADADDALDDPLSSQTAVPNVPVVANRRALRRLSRSEVVPWRPPHAALAVRFFRLVDTSMPVRCGACGHFFEEDEFEMAVLESGRLPFTREPAPGEGSLEGPL